MSSPDAPAQQPQRPPQERLAIPSIGLVASSGVWIFILSMYVAVYIGMLTSDAIDELEDPEFYSIETKFMIETTLGIVLIAANACVLYGAVQMRHLRRRRMAVVAATIAAVPCCGPCYIVGMPFGIWALRLMDQPEIKEAFYRA